MLSGYARSRKAANLFSFSLLFCISLGTSGREYYRLLKAGVMGGGRGGWCLILLLHTPRGNDNGDDSVRRMVL